MVIKNSKIKHPLPIDYLYRGIEINPVGIAAQELKRKISYQELKCKVEALALCLQQRVASKSHIGLCAQNHIEHIVAYLAIIAAGLIWVPINPKNGAQLNASLMKQSDLALLLIDQASKPTIDHNLVPMLSLNDGSDSDCNALIKQFSGQAFTPARPNSHDVMGIKFTGGTSGEPKGVMQSHNNVAAVIDNMQSEFDFKKSDCNLAVAPLTHGGSHYIIPILAVGGCHLLLTEPNIDDIVNAFKYHQASVSFMPPTLIYKLIEYPNICADDFPKLRHLTYSAAPMPPERIVQVISTIGPKLSTVYGQTEAPMTITAMSSHDMTVAHLQASVGKACKYSEVTTFNAQGEPLPIGETGEIAVKGDIVMLGYFNQPDKTQSIFNNGWLLTGDLGFIDKNQYVFIQGRSKEVMITGGFNVYPGEVENAAIEINDVNECVAFSMEDKYWGERIEIVVKLNKGSAISSEYIRQKLKPILGAVKTPKAVHIVDNIPRNPVGKITKRDIKSLIYPE